LALSDQNSKPAEKCEPVDYGLLPGLIGFNLRRTQIKIFQAFAQTVGRHDVTPGQFGVLEIVNANPGLNQSELGAAMGVDRSTVVAVIDRLEDRDLVVRAPSPKDRRSYALRLSRTGEELLAILQPLVREHDQRAGQCLNDDEQAALISYLRRLEAHN
jgi:DNA-binding MarR family transcriptional regulator